MIKNLILDGNGIIYLSKLNEKMQKERFVMKGVLNKLKELSKTYDLYVLTDGSAKTEEKKRFFKKEKILKYFKGIMSSYESGMQKSQGIKPFNEIIKKYEMKKSETLFIGHDLIEIKHAKIAGIKSLTTNNLTKIKL
jgi:FMN phosphatase YigB (HAD superfamily)